MQSGIFRPGSDLAVAGQPGTFPPFQDFIANNVGDDTLHLENRFGGPSAIRAVTHVGRQVVSPFLHLPAMTYSVWPWPEDCDVEIRWITALGLDSLGDGGTGPRQYLWTRSTVRWWMDSSGSPPSRWKLGGDRLFVTQPAAAVKGGAQPLHYVTPQGLAATTKLIYTGAFQGGPPAEVGSLPAPTADAKIMALYVTADSGTAQAQDVRGRLWHDVQAIGGADAYEAIMPFPGTTVVGGNIAGVRFEIPDGVSAVQWDVERGAAGVTANLMVTYELWIPYD